MALNHFERIRTTFAEASVTPLVLTGIGACFAVAIGLLLVGTGPTAAVLLPMAIGVVLLALYSPYWALVATVAQFAFIPCEGELLGYFVPNALQFLAPVVFGAALLQALKDADEERLTLRLPDLFVGGLGLWGLGGMFLSGRIRWKRYGNKMLFPMVLYYAVRFLRLDHTRLRRMLLVLLGAIAIQSALIIRESMAGSSPLYRVPSGLVQGVKPASGPFPAHWTAATYLCLWPSIFVYAIAQSRNWKGKSLWGIGLMAVLAASTRTMERAGLAASLLAIGLCLLSPRLRRTTMAVLGILAVAFIPWSMGGAGAALLDRFRETDQSRYAYRTAAINLLKSSRWNPIYGIGWLNFDELAGEFGSEEEILAWGERQGTIREIAAGSALHNVWLAVPVEFGGVGALLALAILGAMGVGVLCMLRQHRDSPVDDGLVVSMVGSLVALGVVGYYHNIYTMAESMAVLWTFYGLLTAHPRAFVEA